MSQVEVIFVRHGPKEEREEVCVNGKIRRRWVRFKERIRRRWVRFKETIIIRGGRRNCRRKADRRRRKADRQAPLAEKEKKRVCNLAVRFKELGVRPDHYFTSTYVHAKDTAEIMCGCLSTNDNQIIEAEALTPRGRKSHFNFENIIKCALRKNANLESPSRKTLVLVGHEGGLSQLITLVSGNRLRPLDHLDAVCVEADSLRDLRLGRGQIAWRIPVKEYQEEELRKKITAKMTVATFLAGFTFTALFITLTRDIPSLQGLFKIDKKETIAGAINSALPLLATVCLTAAIALFVAAVYIYDRLTLPEGFWFTSQRTEWEKLPSVVQKYKDQHGLLYGHMVHAWNKVFTPGVIFAAIGFLLIVIYKTSYLLSLLYFAVILGIAAYYWWRRPKLGVD